MNHKIVCTVHRLGSNSSQEGEWPVLSAQPVPFYFPECMALTPCVVLLSSVNAAFALRMQARKSELATCKSIFCAGPKTAQIAKELFPEIPVHCAPDGEGMLPLLTWMQEQSVVSSQVPLVLCTAIRGVSADIVLDFAQQHHLPAPYILRCYNVVSSPSIPASVVQAVTSLVTEKSRLEIECRSGRVLTECVLKLKSILGLSPTAPLPEQISFRLIGDTSWQAFVELGLTNPCVRSSALPSAKE